MSLIDPSSQRVVISPPKSMLMHNQSFAEEIGGSWRDYFPEIIGQSGSLQKALETVFKVARTNSAVLILGESGTGKELIASAVHRLSPRVGKKLVAINCSAIPEDLLEAELFGHEKGAFTGAEKRREGYFETARGGTLFLDEIGEMPLRLQAKLLRVLQDKEFTPIGSSESKVADVRIIAATNLDLDEAVKKKNFRLDLYYRLNVFPVTLPPVRERGEDRRLLLEHFLNHANRIHSGERECYFSQEALNKLVDFAWPGNVRQMQNVIERLVVLSGGGRIGVEHFSHDLLSENRVGAVKAELEGSQPSQAVKEQAAELLPEEGLNLPKYIEELENSMIIQALERTRYNKNQAAKLLGLNRTTLVERIKKRQIVPLNAPSREM